MTGPLRHSQAPKLSRRRGMLAAFLVGAALVVGTVGMVLLIHSRFDRISAADQAERVKAFPSVVTLPLVALADRDAALDTMALPPIDRASLKADLEAGRTRLAWLSLWDDQVVDGDRVTVAASGFSVDVELLGTPRRVAVPIAANGADLWITGLYDGGGGITLGLQTSAGTVLSPVFAPGQSLVLRLP